MFIVSAKDPPDLPSVLQVSRTRHHNKGRPSIVYALAEICVVLNNSHTQQHKKQGEVGAT